MENREAIAAVLFSTVILTAFWIAGTTILVPENEPIVLSEAPEGLVPLPLSGQIMYCLILSLLSVSLSCSLAHPCRKYAVRTFVILSLSSVFALTVAPLVLLTIV